MPVSIRTEQMKFKEPSSNDYVTIDMVSDQTTESRVNEINAAAATAVAAIEAKESSAVANVADVAEVQEMIAEVFDSSKSYSVGDYVIHEEDGVGKLYNFTNNSAAGEWDTSSTGQTSIGNELNNFQQVLSDINDSINGINLIKRGFTRTKLFLKADTATVASQSSLIYSIWFPCEPSTTYHITKKTASVTRVGTMTTIPAVNVTCTRFQSATSDAATDILITSGDSDAYMMIQLFATADAGGLQSLEAHLPSLSVISTIQARNSLTKIVETNKDMIAALEKRLYGTNLLNNGYYYSNRYIDISTQTISRALTTNYSIWLACQPSTTYHITKATASTVRVGSLTTTPATNLAITSLVTMANTTDTDLTITTGANDSILFLQLFTDSDESTVHSLESNLSSLLIIPENEYNTSLATTINNLLNTIINWQNLTVNTVNIPLQNIVGITHFPNNLIDPATCVYGEYVAWVDGSFRTNSNYFRTGYIPVTAGSTYKSNVGRNYAWYDNTYTYLSGEKTTTALKNGVTAPSNAAYIAFSINISGDNIDNPWGLYFTTKDNYNIDTTIENLSVIARPWCWGMKVNWIGDSITQDLDFDEFVCQSMGMEETDYGINGSTIAVNENNPTNRDPIVTRYNTMSDDADIIVVSAGTNDFQYSWTPIGDIESTDNTTFYGAMKNLCEGLITKYPTKVIFFTTPIKRAQINTASEDTDEMNLSTPFSKNKLGKTLKDYRDIIIEVCSYYSIPVCDLWGESLLNPHLSAQEDMFDSVKTHPNNIGRRIMARRVAGYINQLGYNIVETATAAPKG